MSKTITEKINSDVIFENINDTIQGFKFDINNITVGNIHTITVPNSDFTITGTDTAQTLTNKTLTDNSNNIIARGLKNLTTNVTTDTSTEPTIGQYLVATSNTTASWQTITPGSVIFGSNYQYTALSNSITITSAFVSYLTLTTPNISAGTYRIGWSCNWDITGNGNVFNAQIKVTNAGLVNDIIVDSVYTNSNTNNTKNISNYNGFTTVSFATNNTHVITIELNASSTSSIQNRRLEIYRIS